MALFGIKFPWETEAGEGFIAPWTPVETGPTGLYQQSGADLTAAQAASIDALQVNGALTPAAPPLAPAPAPAPAPLPQYYPPAPEPEPYETPVYTPAPLTTIPVGNGTTVLPYSQPTHGDVVLGQLGTVVNGVPISGPGVPEPPHQLVARHWHLKVQSKEWGSFYMFYWRLIDGRCMSYHSPTKTWKIWKPKKHLVISRDPRVSNLRALARLNKRVEKMLKGFQPKPARGLSAKALARTYLSTAERRQLKD